MIFRVVKFSVLVLFCAYGGFAQNSSYWQQRVEYDMYIDFDVENGTYNGYQKLIYHNNSPDTLRKVFYHLYFNAFKPESMMCERTANILDPRQNLKEDIEGLNLGECGNITIERLTQDGQDLKFEVYETILKVLLSKPLPPGEKCVFNMVFTTQVPKLCRRAGKNSKQGIDFSMAQWYPKIAEYDNKGWHPYFYIAREFYGVWGDFDVKIDIDTSYTLAAGAQKTSSKLLGNGKRRWFFEADNVIDFVWAADRDYTKRRWFFEADNVIDFVWAADRDYTHFSIEANDDMTFHFYCQNTPQRLQIWRQGANIIKEAFDFINARYGKYQYDVYSFIEAGDGGMEYPLATLVTGDRSLKSLMGTWVHEFMHSWYQMQLATDEGLYAWMDEGFANFATNEVITYLTKKGLLDYKITDFQFQNDYDTYVNYVTSHFREPICTHSDHYQTNYAYFCSSYTAGTVFLKQLEYVVGKAAFDEILLRYFDEWKFKHPTPDDFMRVAEKVSGLQLGWYKRFFVNSNRVIEYAVDTIRGSGDSTVIVLKNSGNFPMPIDVEVIYKNGKKKYINIPIMMMLGNKGEDVFDFECYKPWRWVSPTYELILETKIGNIESITIDPSFRLADIYRENNCWSNKNNLD